MHIIRHACYPIGGLHTAPQLDRQLYSRMKYGSVAATEVLAATLVQAFVQQLLPTHAAFFRQPWLLAAAAYHAIPTAASTLTAQFQAGLRAHDMQQPVRAHIIRQNLFEGEYAQLDDSQRATVLAQCQLAYQGPSLAGRTLVVIDDVWVTGAHERKIIELLQGSGVHTLCFIYLASNQDQHLAPAIEHALNSAAIRNAQDLHALLCSEPVLVNARLCKHLLRWPSAEGLRQFISSLPQDMVQRLATAINEEGYASCPTLHDNCAVVQAVAAEILEPV